MAEIPASSANRLVLVAGGVLVLSRHNRGPQLLCVSPHKAKEERIAGNTERRQLEQVLSTMARGWGILRACITTIMRGLQNVGEKPGKLE